MNALLQILKATPDQLELTLRDFPASHLSWTPPDWEAAPAEHFGALGTVCHLRDIERFGYHLRLRRVVEEQEPDLDSVDGFELERAHNYAAASVEQALAEFRVARAQTLAQVARWAPADFERKATFAEYRTVTAAGLLQLLASHDLQHLSGLRWLLARLSASSAHSG